MKFFEQAQEIKKQAEALGHEVFLPTKDDSLDNPSYVFDRSVAMKRFYDKIAKSDVILVFNQEKNNIPNYIGPSVLMEMGIAFYLNKPIYIFNDLPESLPYTEEIKALKPIPLRGDLNLLETITAV